MLIFIIIVLIHHYLCGQVEAQTPLMIDRALLDAIKQVESGGDPCVIGAIGDSGRSLGAYQITQPYYSDALQYNPTLGDGGRTYGGVWGIGSETYSEEVIASYMGRYATPERLERQPTDEDIARIHNGGPSGYEQNSTLPYWNLVMTELARQRSAQQTQSGNLNQCSPACTAGQCCSSAGTCNCLSSTFTTQPCTVTLPCPVDSSAAGGKTGTMGLRVHDPNNMCNIVSSSESTVTNLIIGIVVVVVIVTVVTVLTVVVITAVVIKKHSGKRTTVKNGPVSNSNIPTTINVTTNQAYGLTWHHSEGVGEDHIYDYPDISTNKVTTEGNQAPLHATEKTKPSLTTVDESDCNYLAIIN